MVNLIIEKKRKRMCFFGVTLILLNACNQPIEAKNDPSYISENGSFYAYEGLDYLEIVDSTTKKYTIELVEYNEEDLIIHFSHTNIFSFYQIQNNNFGARNTWIIGSINYEYDIIETLITEDSLNIESIYKYDFNSWDQMDNSKQLSADHFGRIQISIKTPDQSAISGNKNSNNSVLVSGPSFSASTSIQWADSKDDVFGGVNYTSTRNTLDLKELVNGENQVLIEYTNDF